MIERTRGAAASFPFAVDVILGTSKLPLRRSVRPSGRKSERDRDRSLAGHEPVYQPGPTAPLAQTVCEPASLSGGSRPPAAPRVLAQRADTASIFHWPDSLMK